MAFAALVAPRVAAPPRKTTWIEVEPFDAAKIERKAREMAKREREERDKNRIVQTRVGKETKEAAPDAFLGEKTQVVDRQTVSKEQQTKIGSVSRPEPAANTRPKPETQAEVAKKPEPIPALSKLGLAMIPSPKKAAEEQEDPFRDRVAAQDSEGVPQDYVKGFKESESTALNTKEFVFFGYFQRIRQRLDLSWSISLREHLTRFYRGGRALASEMDHTTRLLVTLNSTGEVTGVEVVEESGTRTLDDAAVKAFNRAGPFPNPPRGILDQAGQIKIRWDFVLKT